MLRYLDARLTRLEARRAGPRRLQVLWPSGDGWALTPEGPVEAPERLAALEREPGLVLIRIVWDDGASDRDSGL